MEQQEAEYRLLNDIFPQYIPMVKPEIYSQNYAIIAIMNKLLDDLNHIMHRGIGDDLICGYIRYHLKKSLINANIEYQVNDINICISPNEIAFHGIPDRLRFYKNGDLVTIDISFKIGDQYFDSARTYGIGIITENDRKLLMCCENIMQRCLKTVYDGSPVSSTGTEALAASKGQGLKIIKEGCGHRIGNKLHMNPFILFYENNEPGLYRKGEYFCIEPIVTNGIGAVKEYKSQGYITIDGEKAVQFERMISV